jgi:proliferating cell nuclear antigen
MTDIDYSKYNLYIKTVQASAFRVLIEALKEILTDCNLDFSPDSLKVIAMDPSHSVLVHLKLEADKFEVFHCPEPITLGINTLNFFKLIKALQNNDILTLFLEKDNINQLCIKMDNGEANRTTTYRMNLMDLNQENFQIPSVEFDAVITLPSSDFQKICRDMYNLGDNIEIRSYGEQISFSCTGDIASQTTTIGQSNIGGLSVINENTSNIVQGVYALKYLVLFTKCTNLCNTIELFLKNDYPLIIKYNVASLGEIKLCLAPKVDND